VLDKRLLMGYTVFVVDSQAAFVALQSPPPKIVCPSKPHPIRTSENYVPNSFRICTYTPRASTGMQVPYFPQVHKMAGGGELRFTSDSQSGRCP
jgi:hypothetical protein